MSWETILTSGFVPAVVGALAGGIVGGIASYMVGQRLQRKEHEYQEEREGKNKAEAERGRLESTRLNTTQEGILNFCQANPSERYNLQSGSGTYWLVSVDTDEKKEFPDMTIGNQIEDMISKGYMNELQKIDSWFLFELTEQGRKHKL